MTYIDRLNAFHRWLEHNYLPHVSQLMYFRLLDFFNRCGWAEWVSVDNLRLMSMVHVESKNTLLRARDKLVQAGWLEFRKGKKGVPNQYRLGNGAKNAPETELETAPQTGPIIRPKTKTKDKEEIPPPPLRVCASEPDPALAAVMTAYMDKINPTPSQTSMDELKGYLDQMGAECCLRAIDIALDERKPVWSYIRGILRSKLSQGVRCLADWDKLEEAREKSAAGGKPSGPKGIYGGKQDPDRAKQEMDWLEQFVEGGT